MSPPAEKYRYVMLRERIEKAEVKVWAFAFWFLGAGVVVFLLAAEWLPLALIGGAVIGGYSALGTSSPSVLLRTPGWLLWLAARLLIPI